MALRTLLSARAGLETTRGTGVAPTRLLYFANGRHDQGVGTIMPTELRNSYFPTFRAYAGLERNGFTFDGDMTFDDLIWWANLHIKAVASGSGAGADKTWTFTPAASTDDLKSATLEWGYADSIGAARPAFSVPYVLGDELTLNWRKAETVTFLSTLRSAKAATQVSAFTSSLSDRVTTSALGTATQVYIDSATIGSTADSNIIDPSWTLRNGLVHFDPLNNSGVAQDLLRPNPRSWELGFSRYFANDTERDVYITKTERKVRIKTVGPSLGAGTYLIQLDLYGVLDTVGWSEVDGLGFEQYVLRPIYDSGAASDFSLQIVNATASIT
jgi:hypothetical protein